MAHLQNWGCPIHLQRQTDLYCFQLLWSSTHKSLICIFFCVGCWLRHSTSSTQTKQQCVSVIICLSWMRQNSLTDIHFPLILFVLNCLPLKLLHMSVKPVGFKPTGHHLSTALHFDLTVNSWGVTFDPFILLSQISLCGFQWPMTHFKSMGSEHGA